MDRDVKPRRTYDGAARQARTRRTQAAVVEAAQSLFVERGYAATTIDAISDRSDTPPTTVYRLFSSKLGILEAMLDVSIGGDDEAVAMADRPQVRALFSAEDPKGQLVAFAALLREVMARVGPVHRILADAAEVRPGRGSLLTEIARQRHEGQQGIARSLARSGALRPGSKSATPPTSSTPSRLPRCTPCSSPTGAGAASATRTWLRSILVDQLLP
jgi:Transcriptional regulator